MTIFFSRRIVLISTQVLSMHEKFVFPKANLSQGVQMLKKNVFNVDVKMDDNL